MSAGNQGTQRCVESWPQPGDVVENDKSIGQRFDIGAQFQGLAVVVKAGDSCRANKFFTASEFAYYGVDQSSCEPAGLVASERHMAGAVRQLGRVSVLMAACFTSATRKLIRSGDRERDRPSIMVRSTVVVPAPGAPTTATRSSRLVDRVKSKATGEPAGSTPIGIVSNPVDSFSRHTV